LGLVDYVRSKNLEGWALAWAKDRARRRLRGESGLSGPRHLLFSFCDHWEPLWKEPDDRLADARVEAWRKRWPELASRYRDADGCHPQHSFFFPGEQYRPAWLDALAEIARGGFGEVEFHLHHDGDTSETLRRDLARYLGEMASHGHFARDPDGKVRFAFIHGNWCLANARADGRWCGVDDEIPLLFDAGCYADFTFPAAPDPSQPAIVNSIYWPAGDIARRRGYEDGELARVGERKTDRILLVEGPIALALRLGGSPLRIESSHVTADDPPTPERIRTWVEQDIHVEGRPEWVFVKVHTHGAPEKQAASLLGDGGRMLHEELTTRYNDGRRWKLHYVTAREAFNVASAAMDGMTGDPGHYRDYVLPRPPVRARA
jgi:hypothetical protein